jgi:2-oxoglutarate dehydrogenase E1 component
LDLVVERKKVEGESPTSAIVRVEQLYPRPVEEIKAELARFPNLKEVRWVQDEPANMGPWPHMKLHLSDELPQPLTRISRPESTSPAVGQASRHKQELENLLREAFA